MVTHLAFDLLHQPATKDALVALLVQVMKDPVQKKVATDFVIDVLKREEVFAIVNDVAKNIVASVLNDEQVKVCDLYYATVPIIAPLTAFLISSSP